MFMFMLSCQYDSTPAYLGKGHPYGPYWAVRVRVRVNEETKLHIAFQDGKGVEQSDVEAARWFHEAAVQGDAKAQWSLGITFQNGKEVGQSDVVAARWFQKAAEQGHANALDELGVCYCMALELNRNLWRP